VASVQSTTGSRGVRISSSNAGYTMFRGSVKGTGYTLHSPVSPSLPLPCVTVCHHVSTELYYGHGKKLHGSWAWQSSVLLYQCLQFILIQASTSPKSFPLVKAITGLSLPTFMWTELS